MRSILSLSAPVIILVAMSCHRSEAAPTAPTASFTVVPASPVAKQKVQFTNTTTGSPTSFSWTFGDGATSTTRSPSHTYSAAGAYTVSLTASNAKGSSTASQVLTVSTGTSVTLTRLTASSSSLALTLGGASATLTLTGTYSDGTSGAVTDATWTTSSATVASVSAGVVVPLAVGSATITATKSGQTATVSVTVKPVFPLPDTGQISGYTSTPGEDADFTINPPSLTDNGDGTITDNVTGLMWQQIDGGEMTFASAQSYCSSLRLGGYSDWRMPSHHELFGIHDFDSINPALNTSVFDQTYGDDAYIRELYWWSSDILVSDATRVWVTNAGGGIGPHPMAETTSAGGSKYFHVRAVRNPNSMVLPNVRFVDNGDGTVTDNNTGLIWQKVQSTSTCTWEQALAYASSLSLAGKTDWRLPNIKELQSLVNVSSYNPSFDATYFTNIAAICDISHTIPTNPGTLWSSTSMCNNMSLAWDMHDVYYGIVSYSDKSTGEYVLCVRGGY